MNSKKYFCNPLNLEYRYQFFRKLENGEAKGPFKVYREAADPTLILHNDTYFLFPSMTSGFFTSTDLYEWEFNKFLGDVPIYHYAPDVRVVGEYMVFSASNMGENCNYYRTKDPRTDEFEMVPGEFAWWDPNTFQDDDGRVYFYWGCSNQEPIYGLEIDPNTYKPLGEKQGMFDSNSEIRGYERAGNEHVAPKTEEEIEEEVERMYQGMLYMAKEKGEDIGMSEEAARQMLRGYFGNKPYLEGPWLNKYKGKYYLQYAIPGTEFNVYGDGCYVADSPLGPYKPAKNNPYSYKPGGFITGAGHGSTLEDKNKEWWHISSMRISNNESFERRLGLWKAGFDVDGELYCDQRFGDWPVAMDSKPFDNPDFMLLSYKSNVSVSSGNGAENITDENIQSFWKASSSNTSEWAIIDLEELNQVSAIQINFVDDGMVAEELPNGEESYKQYYDERWIDQKLQVTRWVLEGSVDGENFITLCDKSNADTDLSHDFVVLDKSMELRYVKLTVKELPYNQKAAVAGIRVFGKGNQGLPEKAENVHIDLIGSMDMNITWKCNDAVGAVVMWGHEADKLYHSRMVYGENKCHIGALVEGQAVFVRIDTFNKNEVHIGDVKKCR